MKKFIMPFIATAVVLTSCGPTTNDAVKFNDQVVDAQKECIKGEKDFFKACDGYNPDEIKTSYESFSKSVETSLKSLQEIKDRKEFTTFKESAFNMVNAYSKLIPVEYKEYARIYSLSNEQYTSKDSADCVAVAAKINTTLNPLVTGFIAEQEAFAKQWNFKLTKTNP
jgi:hypothetical protein